MRYHGYSDKRPRCVLCGSLRVRLLEKETCLVGAREGHPVFGCAQCGLAFVHPQPALDGVLGGYDEDYVRRYADQGLGFAGGDFEVADYLRERLERIEHYVAKGVLLDVGCAFGAFLHHARKAGWAVIGVDVSSYAAAVASQKFGLKVFVGMLEEARLPTAYFDVIHLNHALEHLPDPFKTLYEVRRLVKPGGLVVIEVPNEFGDLFGWIREVILRRPRQPYAVPSPHLFFFTPRTLLRLLRLTGFRLLEWRTPRRPLEPVNRGRADRLPRRLIYWAERILRCGPLIEVFARPISG